MTCLQVLFLASLVAFVSIGVYILFVTGQRSEPDIIFPTIVNPWDTQSRRVNDVKPVTAMHKGATRYENPAADKCAGAARATTGGDKPGS